jgi:hypothetical protein
LRPAALKDGAGKTRARRDRPPTELKTIEDHEIRLWGRITSTY